LLLVCLPCHCTTCDDKRCQYPIDKCTTLGYTFGQLDENTGEREMFTVIEGGIAKHERNRREALIEADPAQHNAHVKDFRNQPGYFEKYFLPQLKQLERQ